MFSLRYEFPPSLLVSYKQTFFNQKYQARVVLQAITGLECNSRITAGTIAPVGGFTAIIFFSIFYSFLLLTSLKASVFFTFILVIGLLKI